MIRVVTTSFPRHPGDPAGHFVLGQCRALAQPVQVVAGGVGAWQPVPTVRYGGRLFAGHGAPDRLQAQPLRGGLLATDAAARLWRAIRRHVPRGAPIIAHWLLPTTLLAARRGPTLGIAHGGDVALLERVPQGRRLARRIDATARALGFVSADLRARFERLAGPARCPHPLLPMGIDPPAPDAAFADELRARAAGRPIVATVGRLVPIKGFDVLDAALAGRDDVAWFAAGGGDQRLARATRLGQLGPARRDALLQVADVVVIPSRRVGRRVEGTPLALMEALQSRAPVVATRTGGMAAVAGPIFVPPDDPRALRAALDAVLAAPPTRQPDPTRFAWSTVGPEHARWARWLCRQASPNRS